ncbi:ferredoxin [Rhodococcus sp. WS4]|nr:ferredoxin [Rhodococcus sp. WS4]
MRLSINDRCAGHGRCYSTAPELIDSDDYGHGEVIGDGVVPPELEQEAQAAVLGCPEAALTLLK